MPVAAIEDSKKSPWLSFELLKNGIKFQVLENPHTWEYLAVVQDPQEPMEKRGDCYLFAGHLFKPATRETLKVFLARRPKPPEPKEKPKKNPLPPIEMSQEEVAALEEQQVLVAGG